VQVHFEAPPGGLVAGITTLVDYPEGLVDLPGNGITFPSGVRSGFPPGSTVGTNDLNFNGAGHALRFTVAGASGSPLPPGQLGRFRFENCNGAAAPTPAQFPCTVILATDPFTNAVPGVRCFVVIE
jgi:hypothetical protein